MRLFRYQPDPGTPLRPMPNGGVVLYFYTLRTHADTLFLLSLITLLCSLPVITAPAAICAMNRVCGQLLRQGSPFPVRTYFEEFRESFFRGFSLGLLLSAFLLSGFISICYGIANVDYRILCIVFGGTEICITLLFGSWVFLIMSIQDLPLRLLISNAIALLLLEPLCSLKLLGAIAVTIAFLWLLFPFSLFSLPVQPGLIQFTLCWLSRDAIQHNIIDRAKTK